MRPRTEQGEGSIALLLPGSVGIEVIGEDQSRRGPKSSLEFQITRDGTVTRFALNYLSVDVCQESQ